ncbi:MAG: gliding motility protein GldM [Ferruginibacter sp.]
MALPKEPRQKMINLMYLVLTALLALNVSSEILNAFKVVNNSLDNSNINLTKSSNDVYSSIVAAMNKAETHEKAALLQPKADALKNASAAFNTYLQGVIKNVINESDFDSTTGKYKEDDLEASTRLMDTKGEGKILRANLTKYVNDVNSIMGPEYIKKAFPTGLPIDTESKLTDKEWTIKYFHMVPTVASITILSKLQNDIKNTESQGAKFLLSQVGAVEVVYDKFIPLISQSSNYVMPGDEITIRAGVGAFSSSGAPTVSINGQNFDAAATGYGETKINAAGGGPHSIPIRITFKDQQGKVQNIDSKVDYVVGTPGGASVMLDKMNVFYIGVDNPVTIGSPTGLEKTHVSMTGGTISQGNTSNRIVRVSTLGAASITIDADGKKSTYNFRVKRIPDPVFKVGSGKARVPVVEFKNQQYCRADLGDDFLFDLKFNVISATVYFSGAGFPSTQIGTITGNNLSNVSALIQRCTPGSSVTFVNIKVQGPDGAVRTIDERSISLY